MFSLVKLQEMFGKCLENIFTLIYEYMYAHGVGNG